MTATDPFAHDDAAYVLGALSEEDRAAFEQHLIGCRTCRDRVRTLAGLPDLLAQVAPDALAGAVPDTLLPGLLRRVAAERRRRTWLTTGLGAVATACLVLLAVVLWPSSSAPAQAPRPQAMSAVVASPVQATAALAQRPWGTEIDLVCRYGDAAAATGYSYRLVVVDTHGARHELGSWTLAAGGVTDFASGTALRSDQIRRVEVVTADGNAILRLDT